MKLSPSQRRQLVIYEDLLSTYGQRLGVIGPAEVHRLRTRHIDDCVRAAILLSPADHLTYDLGSGAGLPGVVLAIAVPACRFVLAESRRRRAGFLEMAVERLELQNAEVHAGRAEDLPGSADVVTARAFAPLPVAWQMAFPLLRPGGRMIFFAGGGFDPASVGAVREPEPAAFDVVPGLANQGPLVIMARG